MTRTLSSASLQDPNAVLVRRLERLGPLTAEVRARVRHLAFRQREFAEDTDVLSEGERPRECCVVTSGIVYRYRMLQGGKRQIFSLHFAGDFIDLQSLYLHQLDHSVMAMTPVVAAFVTHRAMESAIRESADLRTLLMRHALTDAALFREHIACVGRRTGYQRICHLFCEVYLRMADAGLLEDNRFVLPMTQVEIGDATGLSQIHVNRVLKRLQHDRLISCKRGACAIVNLSKLRQAAQFDDTYLHFRRGTHSA